MIFGIGTDLVEIKRFNNINIDSFAKRILSDLEFQYFNLAKNKNLFLAKKFCTKEAVSKAFGVGIGSNLSFRDITIVNNENGKPICIVDKNIAEKITNSCTAAVHVSVTDSKEFIQSFAVVEVC